ncbi:glycosyltransferase [Herbiconiux daphne]|uniref:Glycosyltransferase n=1 Tax=Herbiconiux daphne TaxID=2970914 RepID=A0ABT2H6J8_9MICO|nr:glycosyltransferase [Herbiconiux daphne]MCS5735570.1 glycosyltransferase [Herbiconiux daphne]
MATLVTPDGAYGGPIRVALNQLGALQSLGHSVELVAGTRGYEGEVPTVLQGVPVSLFPVRSVVPRTGFAGLASSGLQSYLSTQLPAADAVHVHIARDLITLPAAVKVAGSGTPLVLQPHGMIDESERPLAAVVDAMYTRRALRAANGVLALTELEAASLRSVAKADLPIDLIANGMSVTDDASTTQPRGLEVLFLARLHPRKRAVMFVEMARTLLASGADATFTLVGPDEGDAAEVERLIQQYEVGDKVRWEGSLSPEETLQRMSRASIYVLPSINEIVPMSVLEAMSLGIPVVITTSNGLAQPLAEGKAGVVVDESLDGLVRGVEGLIGDASLRADMGARGRRLVRDKYSITAVAQQLNALYSGIAGSHR